MRFLGERVDRASSSAGSAKPRLRRRRWGLTPDRRSAGGTDRGSCDLRSVLADRFKRPVARSPGLCRRRGSPRSRQLLPCIQIIRRSRTMAPLHARPCSVPSGARSPTGLANGWRGFQDDVRVGDGGRPGATGIEVATTWCKDSTVGHDLAELPTRRANGKISVVSKSSVVARVLDGDRLECQVVSPRGERLTLTGNTAEVEPDGRGVGRVAGQPRPCGQRVGVRQVHLPEGQPAHSGGAEGRGEARKGPPRGRGVDHRIWLTRPATTTKQGWCSACFADAITRR